jgi:hypothetical protein
MTLIDRSKTRLVIEAPTKCLAMLLYRILIGGNVVANMLRNPLEATSHGEQIWRTCGDTSRYESSFGVVTALIPCDRITDWAADPKAPRCTRMIGGDRSLCVLKDQNWIHFGKLNARA